MKSEKPRKKLIGENQMKPGENIHSGGTVTGRLTRTLPEHQEALSPRRWAHENPNPQRLERVEPVVSVMVTMDFSDIERRVMAQLENKTGIAEAMLKAVSK